MKYNSLIISYRRKDNRQSTNGIAAASNELNKTSWICQKCTLINPLELTVCSACNCSQLHSEKMVQEATSNGSPKKKDVWSCPQCTLLNSNSLSKCRACKTIREPPLVKVTLYFNELAIAILIIPIIMIRLAVPLLRQYYHLLHRRRLLQPPSLKAGNAPRARSATKIRPPTVARCVSVAAA